MRKLLFAGAVVAAPLLGWHSAQAASAAAPLTAANPVLAPSASVQKVVWVWVGGRRIWRPYASYWRPYWHPYAWHHFVPGHWAFGHWVPGHYV